MVRSSQYQDFMDNTPPGRTHPPPSFSLLSLACLVVANTIGSGVYTTSGFTLESLGSRELVLSVWLAASGLALCGAVSFGALARALPESGGEYLYLSRLFHPSAGFIAGWVSLIAGFAGAEALAAITMMEYTRLEHLPGGEVTWVVALLITLAALHGFLVKAGTAIQNLTVVAKASFILLFVALGIARWQPPDDVNQALSPEGWPWAVSLMWVSLSFTGFNSAIYVAEEARDPRRDVPRAILIGTVVTALLYLLINAVMLYSAPIRVLAGAPDIALVSAAALGGPPLVNAVRALVLLSLFTLLSGMALAGPRIAVKMGQDGYLPPLTLGQAAFAQCLLAVLMTLNSDLRSQLSYLGLTLTLTSALAVATVLRLPHDQRPPLFFPLLYVLGSGAAAAASVQTEPAAAKGFLVTVLSGLLAYLVVSRRRAKQPEKQAQAAERETQLQ